MRDEQLYRYHLTLRILRERYPSEHTYYSLLQRMVAITRDEPPSKRNLIRDIQALQRQGYPIHSERRGRYTYLWIDQDKGGILSTIFEAQFQRREVEIDYRKPGESEETRHIRPMAIAFCDNVNFSARDVQILSARSGASQNAALCQHLCFYVLSKRVGCFRHTESSVNSYGTTGQSDNIRCRGKNGE